MDLVRVTFAGARDIAAVRAQLATWQRAVEQCIATEMPDDPTPVPLLLPRIVRHETGGPAELRFTAPENIGADVLSATRSTDDVIAFLRKVAAALDTLHARHFVHGGLGLPSLWWMRDGSLRFPDAGLAHVLDRLMAVPMEAGAYVAPEVWRGGGLVPASDQYALGVIAYELFTGRKRVVRTDEGIMSVASLTLDHGERLYPGARAEMSDVLQVALSAVPASRFNSCSEFIAALEGQAIAVNSLPTMHRVAWHSGSVWSPQVAALALVALTAVGGAGYALRESVFRRTTMPDIAITMPDVAEAAERTVRALPSPARKGSGGREADGQPRAARGGSRSSGAKGASGTESRPGAAIGSRVASAATKVGSALPSPAPAKPAASAAPAASGGAFAAGGRVASSRSRAGSERLVEQSAAARSRSTLGQPAAQTPAGTVRAPLVLPAPAKAPAVGTLRLRGPAGSRYYVDGVLARPVKGTLAVPPGEHEVDIVIPNVNSTRHRIVVHAGETITVRR